MLSGGYIGLLVHLHFCVIWLSTVRIFIVAVAVTCVVYPAAPSLSPGLCAFSLPPVGSLGPGVSAGSAVVTVFVSSSERVVLCSPLLCCNSFCLVSGCLYTVLMRSALSWYLLRKVFVSFFCRVEYSC